MHTHSRTPTQESNTTVPYSQFCDYVSVEPHENSIQSASPPSTHMALVSTPSPPPTLRTDYDHSETRLTTLAVDLAVPSTLGVRHHSPKTGGRR